MSYIGLWIVFILSFWYSSQALSKVVRYELTATQQSSNISGKKTVDFVLLVNGQLPAPTLEFEEGDQAEITLHNRLVGEEVSIHWHGLLVPPEMDGVPYVNTPPIQSGESFVYRFPIRQSGTYWYHTHTGLQEQRGIYGAIVIHPKQKSSNETKEAVLVVSDWSDENATQILANLRKDGDYYLYKKGTVRSLWGAYQAQALGTYWENEWTRMGGMDLSDVGYDAFLLNGKADGVTVPAQKGDRIRLRLINAAASSYFQISLADQNLRVIASDGQEIIPREGKELLMGMAETYDLMFELPENKAYELKISAQDGSGSVSAWIGQGSKVQAPDRLKPDLYAAMQHHDHGVSTSDAEHQAHGAQSSQPEHKAHANHAAHGSPPVEEKKSSKSDHANHHGHHAHHDHAAMLEQQKQATVSLPPVELLTVDEIRAPRSSKFSDKLPVHEIKLVLGGDMERYVWHINGKAMFEDSTLEIREGELVRFTLENQTMMHHPMHLHGHFFRVLTATAGDQAPWKHTVDVPPHQTRTIEFHANEPGRWMLHCHNLYHMKTGMSRVIRYASYEPSPELKKHETHDPHRHDHIYSKAELELSTVRAKFSGKLMQTWNEVDLRLATGEEFETRSGEAEIFLRRWSGNFLSLLGGVSHYDKKNHALIGFSYLLPMMIESEMILTHRGDLRLDLAKHLQWTSELFSELGLRLQTDERA